MFETNNGDQGFFLKKGDEKFCAEEYRDVFKGEFCC